MMNRWMRRVALSVLTAGLLVAAATAARAEDYVLGAEDVINVQVWLHPELAGSLTLNADGLVTLAPVGEIKAAGLTPKQLGERMADRLSAYLRQTTTVTVTVAQFMSHSVYVTGGVAKPGRYGFERIPTLIDVLGQAGGAIPGADLSGVQVLRKEGSGRRTLSADLSNALRTGDASGLPELKAGDTVVIPGAVAAGAGAPPTSEGVGVLGEVNKPGVYSVGGGLDVWAVLASAGGLTARGKLNDVRLLTHADGGQTVSVLRLREALDHGSRAPILVKPGDVVVVMPNRAGVWTSFTNVLALSQNALNVVVLVDYFNNKKKVN